MKFTHLKKQKVNFEELQRVLRDKGFICQIDGNNLKQFRLDIDNDMEYNYNAYSGRKGRYLSYSQWEDVNNIINDYLDSKNVACKVSSNNIFIVRSLQGRRNENDWYNDIDNIDSNRKQAILNSWS